MKTALIIGSTGLIGSHLLELLLESTEYGKVITFVKRDSGFQNPKLEQHIIDFDKPETYKELVFGDDFFCTIGTTIKNAGSQDAFRKVDFGYPKEFSTIAMQNKVKQFLIISSLGADANSGNFYLKTKGEIQDFLKNCTFESVTVLQPSLLLGNRKEFRLGEKIGAFFMKLFSFVFTGKIKKYKPIQSESVAKAMFTIAQKNYKGFHIIESDEIQEIANKKS
ncbi:NAD-dependent epimerase/dehydratase family protein [Flavobacterium franklandianum]|uniref:NAD-dependent epimerase/dehydratase family protein n=1 Tax=Flavobacterium franklandianum TaxID=2594430 RepID=A0A553CNL7_9FLAO|nr:NAD(P)H-binding protein [Flavobacterium franklandianum]TRX22015.1 NAD-dependent epimerase/dehydratase family protein [Flavobacterium franklandianum]TRX28737.1 NAD-dependent epimerase/dehydratase family protein [Flavobacterium franklandianum]